MRADVVTVSSEKLREDVAKIKPACVIRNGCEFSRISSAPRRKLKRTTIGYVGAISNWFDVELLCEIAKERPDWDVVLVGSTVGANVLPLKNNPNVLLVGEVEYREVPDYLASFDVCLIPFKIIPLTEATNPVKLYEYLSAGRPVVATPLPELLGLEEIDVFTGATADKFVDLIERALQLSDNPVRIKCRQVWAQSNDWSVRAADLRALVF
jgi:glycosyltransferase involved in cell wall biosynthesis